MRLAICFFLAGFAAPGLRKWLAWYPEPAMLIQAFVAAQLIHFCSVIMLHTKFADGPLRLDAPQVVIVLVGFSIVVGAGLTATLCTRSHIYGAAQIVLLYLIWLILAADYAKHPVKTLRLVVIPVVLALVLRHLPVWGRLKTLPKASVGQSAPDANGPPAQTVDATSANQLIWQYFPSREPIGPPHAIRP